MTVKPIIEIELDRYGIIQLLPSLKVSDLGAILELIHQETVCARNFTAEVVRRLIYSPELKIAEIQAWPDTELLQVFSRWAEQTQDSPWKVDESHNNPFEEIKQHYGEYFVNLMKTMNQPDSLYLTQKHIDISGLSSQLQRLSESVTSAAKGALLIDAEIMSATKQTAHLYQSISESLAESLIPLAGGLAATLNQFVTFNQTLNDVFQQNLASSMQSVQASLAEVKSIFRTLAPVGQLFPNLPDISRIGKQIEVYGKASEVMKAGGFAFLLPYWSFIELAQVAGIAKVDTRIRNAVITNKLLTVTRSQAFRADLEYLLSCSSVLKRRWHIIHCALRAHCNRDYAVSIPTLLAQVEGIFTDALVLKQLVVQVNGKLCARDKNGSVVLDKHGKPVQLHGLGQKVQNSDVHSEYWLEGLAKFFTEYLVSERNDIVHGKNTAYDRAKLSTQLLLNIYLLALEFENFEGSD